jgi:hypothetical protein
MDKGQGSVLIRAAILIDREDKKKWEYSFFSALIIPMCSYTPFVRGY